jgi:transaldolase
MKMTKLHQLANLGQSIWLDNISRPLLLTGELQELVDQGLRGVTSNPSIFENAIAGSDDYDEDLNRLVSGGKSVEEIYEALAMADIRSAADILRSVYEGSDGADGYVSLEVNPKLAHDTGATIAEACRLFAALERPNVMIKVPATPAGMPAIKTLIGEGINVNVTLIFSLEQYEAVVTAYISGLQRLVTLEGEVKKVVSVASFFISRVDSAVDSALAEIGNAELQGKIAIDNARIAYGRFREIFKGEGWEKLAAQGGRVQRPLWASTSTKNPSYPDTLYVDSLIGADTVNTLPPTTLEDFLDHGLVATTVETDVARAHTRRSKLAELGIDLDGITKEVLDEGVAAFAKSFEGLIASIAEKRKRLLDDGQQVSTSPGIS